MDKTSRDSIDKLNQSFIFSVDDILTNTQNKNITDALALKELYNKLKGQYKTSEVVVSDFITYISAAFFEYNEFEVNIHGYLYIKAGTYEKNQVIAKLPLYPRIYNIWVPAYCNDKICTLRILPDGTLDFNSSFSFDTDTYLFINCNYFYK